MTNGEDYLFVKLDRRCHHYDLSDKFTLSKRHQNELHTVVQIMQKLLGR